MTFLGAYGGKVTLGLATEGATPNTYVGATNVLPCKPTWTKKNPNRKPVEAALGTPFKDIFVTDGEGIVEFTTESSIYPQGLSVVSDLLLTQSGIGSTVGANTLGDCVATSVTLNILGSTSAQVAGCYADTIVITGKASAGVWLAKVTWKGMVDPVFSTVITPVPVAARGFQWRDVPSGGDTLLGTSAVKDISEYELTLKHNVWTHYGHAGLAMPSHGGPGPIETSFKITKLHLSTAEYLKFLAAATTGSVVFGMANATPKSFSFALSNCVYTEGDFTLDIKKATLETYAGYCETPAGVSPLITTIV